MTLKAPLLEVKDLKVHFPLRGGVFMKAKKHCKAVDGVSLTINQGETVGLVGESGCGKTTLGKTILHLIEPTAGSVHFQNKPLSTLSGRMLRPYRRNLQMIFQDPAESLNGHHSIASILEEPLIIHKLGTRKDRQKRVDEVLEQVGLSQPDLNRFPFEFSGGQRQRIGIARAIMLKPKLIICDEPVSALDVSIQSQILNLLLELQEHLKLSYLLISHNLAVVKHMADRVNVMYLGKIVESAPTDELYNNPKHPYTQALLDSILSPDPEQRDQKTLLKGTPPSPINPPPGCPFHERCPQAEAQCSQEVPLLCNKGDKDKPPHIVACHNVT